MDCHLQESAHISLIPFSAFHPSADLAGCEALFAKAEAGKTAGVSLVTENGRVFGAGLALNEEEIYYIPVEGMITEAGKRNRFSG